MPTPAADRSERGTAIVEEHIRHENERDLDGILSTSGEHPRYGEEPRVQLYEEISKARSYDSSCSTRSRACR